MEFIHMRILFQNLINWFFRIQSPIFATKKEQLVKWLGIFINTFTGHGSHNFGSMNHFVKWLHEEVDAASLGIGRFFFGIIMLIDIPAERGGGYLDLRFGNPQDCHFPLISAIKILPLPQITILYFVMWLGSLGIALGYKFKASCLMFNIPYWYIFFLDKTTWNNHSYLYGLCGLLFSVTDANKYFSIDNYRLNRKHQTVPFWNYFILKFQFFIMYFVAGLKKMSSEWLSGHAMTNLSYHWVFTPFRIILGPANTDLLIIHWFGAIFDLTIAFWLIFEKTRIVATLFSISFHFMNSRLFEIGMFPWLCLVELILFYEVGWPRKMNLNFLKCFRNTTSDISDKKCTNIARESSNTAKKIDTKKSNILQNSKKIYVSTNRRERIRVCLILTYCFIQITLPYSHLITKGYNNWTNGIYGYSWDMMIHSYDTLLTSVKIVDNGNGEVFYLHPHAYTSYDRWTKHADMAIQYAECIRKNLQYDFIHNKNSVLSSENISIYFDVWCSLNGRFQQRVYNPNQDILQAKWSPFFTTEWVLPLFQELTNIRSELASISDHVLSWNNNSDVLFIADYPDLTMETFISNELANVSLTVLKGSVQLAEENGALVSNILNSDDRITIESGKIHKVITLSKSPSCYMYTYFNKTMSPNQFIKNNYNTPSFSGVYLRLVQYIQGYTNFFALIKNAMMYFVFGVNMPRINAVSN